MEITPLGDSALLVRLVEDFENAPNDALKRVLAAKTALDRARIPGVIEVTPAYSTIAIFYDPVRAVDGGAPVGNVSGWFDRRIRETLSGDKLSSHERGRKAPIEIPVCYDAEFGFDLDEVAKRAGLDSNEVVDLHSNAEYRVHCLGFTGGFAFLGGLPAKIETPRRDVPRKEIPGGSVAIGGRQTGIYPIKSPGGWNVIGRTALKLFDPTKNPPTLLRAGDSVRFRSITREEFERSRP